MGATITEFLKALPTVAGSPLAFIGYIVVIIAWVTTYLLTGKTKRVFKSIDKLPEADRIQAIGMEYKTVPRDGVTAAEWLQAKQANYKLITLAAIVVVILALIGISAYLAHDAIQAQRTSASNQELMSILDQRAKGIAAVLRGSGDQKATDEFLRLHAENIRALASGNQVASHDFQNAIEKLLLLATGNDGQYVNEPHDVPRHPPSVLLYGPLPSHLEKLNSMK